MAFTDDILEADHRTGQIKIHTAADFEGMRAAGLLAAQCLDMLTPHVVPGVVTDGRVHHRRGVTDVPGLYFLGLSWQHTRGSALLGFVQEDATFLADRIQADRQGAVSGTAPATKEPSS